MAILSQNGIDLGNLARKIILTDQWSVLVKEVIGYIRTFKAEC